MFSSPCCRSWCTRVPLLALMLSLPSAAQVAETPTVSPLSLTPLPSIEAPAGETPADISGCVSARLEPGPSSRTRMQSSCTGTGPFVGDKVLIDRFGNFRASAPQSTEEVVDIICANASQQTVSLAVAGSSRPWLQAGQSDLSCSAWSADEMTCSRAGAEVLVCDAITRRVMPNETGAKGAVTVLWPAVEVVEPTEDTKTPVAMTTADDDVLERGSPARVAVYDFEMASVDPLIGRVVTSAIADELRKLQRLSVIGVAEIEAMLDHEARKQLIGCDDESCLSEIAAALGVDILIVGSLSAIGGDEILTIRRIDQRAAKVTAGLNKRFPADGGQAFLAAVGPVVEEIFPDYALRPNKERGVSIELVKSLNPPPLPPWVFWTSTGVVGGLTAAGAVTSAVAAGFAYRYSLTHQSAIRGEEVSGADLKSQADLADRATVAAGSLFATAVIGGLAAAATYFYTDFSPELEEGATP